MIYIFIVQIAKLPVVNPMLSCKIKLLKRVAAKGSRVYIKVVSAAVICCIALCSEKDAQPVQISPIYNKPIATRGCVIIFSNNNFNDKKERGKDRSKIAHIIEVTETVNMVPKTVKVV